MFFYQTLDYSDGFYFFESGVVASTKSSEPIRDQVALNFTSGISFYYRYI
jgi:hypothetical protein